MLCETSERWLSPLGGRVRLWARAGAAASASRVRLTAVRRFMDRFLPGLSAGSDVDHLLDMAPRRGSRQMPVPAHAPLRGMTSQGAWSDLYPTSPLRIPYFGCRGRRTPARLGTARPAPAAGRGSRPGDMTMHKTKNDLSEKIRTQIAGLLQERLAEAIDLASHAKQAHWNVKGPVFIALHELFDQVYEHAGDHADLLAERIVQL